MNIIDFETARGRRWDCIVVGTSFAAFFFARYQSKFRSVLFIERGSWVPHADQIAANGLKQPPIAMENTSGHPKWWVGPSGFGGGSNCWWAGTPRFHPDDFRLQTLHGVGEDWPLSYDDLEEAYCDAEEAMDVAGAGSEHILPRSRPFPAPPHAPAMSDRVLRAHSSDWFPQPNARSTSIKRAHCCSNGVCSLCPIDSKFTILNALSDFEQDDFHVLLDTEARELTIEGQTAVSALVRGADDSEAELKADAFALAANPINNSAILMRSGVQNEWLGTHIHEQLGQFVWLDIDQDNYFGGTAVTGHGYSLYAGDHRREAGAVLIENHNTPQQIRLEPGRWTQRLVMLLIAEDLPQKENHVSLVDDEPVVKWGGHAAYARRGLDRAIEQLPSLLPFDVERILLQPERPTEAHIQGATRMGATEAEGVVDKHLKLFAASNVWCLGAGAFRSCSPANPTLTLSALSIHAARAV